MKKSTKIAMGIGTGVALLVGSLITALAGKGKTNEEADNNCIEGECNEVEDSEESTENVEN